MNASRGTLRARLAPLAVLWLSAAVFADDAAPPAVGCYVLEEQRAEGAAGETLLELKMSLRFTTLSDAWTTIPLFSVEDGSILSVRVRDGRRDAVHLRRTDRRYEILARRADEYEIELAVALGVRRALEGHTANLPFLPAVKSLYKITLEGADLDVAATPEVNFGTAAGRGGTTEVFLYGGAAGRVALTWRPRGGAAARTLVFADQTALARVSRGAIRLDADLHYSILQGRVGTFELACPPNATLVGVAGKGIRDWEYLDRGDRRLLRVSLHSEATEVFDLRVSIEQTLPAFPVEAELPAVVPLGVERERGFVAVAPGAGIQTEVVRLAGASQADLQDLPPEAFGDEADIHLVFRYLARPYALAVRVDDVAPKVTAEVVSLATVGKDAVRLATLVRYAIRDAGVFAFRIRLDEGLRLADLEGREINNWQVKDGVLEVGLRSKVMGEYALLVKTERAHDDPKSIPVPVLELLGVEGERGHLGIVPVPGGRVETLAAEGLTQVNPGEFPGIAGEKPQAVEAAYRYLRHPWALTVTAADVEPEIDCRAEVIFRFRPRDLELDAALHYAIRKAGVFSLRLKLPPDLRISELAGRDIDDWKRDPATGEVTVTLRSSTTGEYDLRVKAERALTPGARNIELPRIDLAGVRWERGFLAVVTDPAIRVRTNVEALRRIVEADLKDLPDSFRQAIGGEPALAFKYFEPEWTVALSVEAVEPRVTADAFHLLSLGEDLLHTAVTVHYRILHAGVSRFRVRLPKEARHVEIEGENVKSRDEEKDGNGGVWTVTLHAPRKDDFDLYITFQRDLAKNDTLKYEGIEVLDVDRETGYLSVAARPEVEIGEPILSELTPIDDSEIPAPYRAGITVPLLNSFRYLRPGYSLGLPLNRHEGTDVLVAVVEACRLSSAISEEGHLITDMVCRVRNRSQQYLELVLPAEAKFWHAFVGDARVTPLAGRGDDGGVSTLIPIAHSAKGEEVADVRVRWARDLPALGAWGTLDLQTPPLKVPVLRLGWTVSLPEGYDLAGAGGNMRRVRVFEAGVGQLDPERPAPDIARGPESQALQIVTTNFNAQVIEASRGGRGGSSSGGGGVGTIYTGSKPTGEGTHLFQTLIPLGEPGRIRLHYVRHSAGTAGQGVLLLGCVAGSWFFWNRRRPSASRKIGALFLASLALLGIQTLLERDFEEYLSIPTWTFAGMAAMFAGTLGYARWKEWRETHRPKGPVPAGPAPLPPGAAPETGPGPVSGPAPVA